MAKRRHTPKLKWKHLGFIPNGWDESQMIKYGDEGFLFLCNELRNDYRNLINFTIKDRTWKPGRRGGNCSNDWTGLDEAIHKPGAKVGPPKLIPNVLPRTLGDDEREQLGRTAHQNWVAVMEQRRKCGHEVSRAELRPWSELLATEQEIFRRSGEALALPEYLVWDTLAAWRKLVGERAFRKKMFEISVSAAIANMNPGWNESQRYHASDLIVNLSGMLEVPMTPQAK